VDWEDRPSGRRPAVNRMAVEIEDRVLRLRRELKETSDLGEYGAVAIHRELLTQGETAPPSGVEGVFKPSSGKAPRSASDRRF